MKNFQNLDKEMWEKSWKIILLMKKPSNLNLGQGKKNQRFVRKETSQNKILFDF